MTGQTQHLSLPQWHEDDYVLMDEFNQAFSNIDGYVDTVNGQLVQLESYLAGQIGVVGNNAIRDSLLDRILGNVTELPNNAWFGLLFDKSNVTECVNIPVFVKNGAYLPGYEYPIGNPRSVPTIGLHSHTSETPDDSFSGTVRKTINITEPRRHLHCVLYVTGIASPTSSSRMQYNWALPWKWTFTFSGMTVACKVNGVSASFAGTEDAIWPEDFSTDQYSGTTPYRIYSFDIDGNFNGQTVIDFPITCSNTMSMHALAIAVLMV